MVRMKGTRENDERENQRFNEVTTGKCITQGLGDHLRDLGIFSVRFGL